MSRVVTSNEEGVLCSMKTAYFMAKEDLAISKHSALQKCPAACTSQYTYSHTEFHDFLAISFKMNFCQKYVIIDESTDISIHKKLIVYVKIPVAETLFCAKC